MPRAEMKPKQYPTLARVKEKLAQAIQQELKELTAESGNRYYGVEFGSELVIDGVQGQLRVAWNGLRDAGLAQAATIERGKTAIANMAQVLTPEQRKALIAQLSKGL